MSESALHPRFTHPLAGQSDPDFDYSKTSISQRQGEFLWSLIRENGYRETIEIGCALGVSSLYICDALSRADGPSHTIVDPNQTTQWRSTGVRNLEAHGFDCFTLVEQPSEIALPRLLEAGERFELGFIDGWHTFDHALVDFFYLNRMVPAGGMIVFDDTCWPSISKLLQYLKRYPAYEPVVPEGTDGSGGPANIVALKKVAEDERRYDWFAPF